MDVHELGNRYMVLRSELARAYESPVWDSTQIDDLTDAIADTESALAASGASQCFAGSEPSRSVAATFMAR